MTEIHSAISDWLDKIENEENIKILLAVESGSRAWGFASPDSDFDVRFIYVRTQGDYLKLEKTRDVLECILNAELDITGWDIKKALQLAHASNPTLYEWLNSPIVYREHPFAEKMRKVVKTYFSSRAGLHHYLNMVEGNYREYLKGDAVKLKKYFYVLRPILACRWILANKTPPPMAFQPLMESQMEAPLIPVIEDLLQKKQSSPEMGEGPRIDALNKYIEESFIMLEDAVKKDVPDGERNWDDLNGLFREALGLHS